MSGWPWMKDESVAIADAIGEDDRRPSVKQLIDENRELIDQVESQLLQNELYDVSKHDDLWILRFLLSHEKNTPRALEAAEATLRFRKTHKLDSIDIRAFPPQERDQVKNEAFQHFMNSGIGTDAFTLVVPNKRKLGVVFCFNITSFDTHKLGTLDPEDWMAAMIYVNEYSFQWLDYITRTTGRLTKAVHLIDVADVTWSMYDLTTQTKYTNATKIMKDFYPQAVQAYLVCHAPYWIETPWKLLKPLLPTRVVAKLDFLNPDVDADRERLQDFVPTEFLPERFGGEYKPWPPKFPPPLSE